MQRERKPLVYQGTRGREHIDEHECQLRAAVCLDLAELFASEESRAATTYATMAQAYATLALTNVTYDVDVRS